MVGAFPRLQLRRKPDSGPESGEMRSFDALLDYNRCSDSGTQIIIGLSTDGRFMLISSYIYYERLCIDSWVMFLNENFIPPAWMFVRLSTYHGTHGRASVVKGGGPKGILRYRPPSGNPPFAAKEVLSLATTTRSRFHRHYKRQN